MRVASDGAGLTGLVANLLFPATFIAFTGVVVFAFTYWLFLHLDGDDGRTVDQGPVKRSLFDQHPDAVFELDNNLVLVHLNPVACRMLEGASEDLVGAGLDAIVAPDRVPADREQLRATLRGEARIFESAGRTANDRRVRVQVTSIPRFVEGRVVGIYAIVKNVDAERQMHEQLAASEARLRSILEHSMDGIMLSDPVQGRLLECNRAAEELFGRSQAELRKCSRDQVFDSQKSNLEEFVRQRDETGRASAILYAIRPDGRRVPVEATSAMFRDGKGRWRSSVTLRDISERMQLNRQRELLAAAFRSASEALLICDLDWRVLDANEAYRSMVGLERDAVIGERPSFLNFREQSDRIMRGMEAEGEWHGELLLDDADGMLITTRAGISQIRGSHGSGRFMVVHLEDISQIREFQRRIDFLSYNDDLTGLPNRSALQYRFSKMAPASGSGQHLAVVYLDLDRFKAVNESLGHSVGDEILVEVGRRLRSHCGKADFVARLGGDDFVIVLAAVDDSEHALRRSEHLIRELAMPIEAAEQKIFSSASAGVVFCADAEEKLEDLLRRADAAHATAKRRGRGQLQLYDSSMQREVEEHALVETHLREAIRQGELFLVFQPIVDLHDGRIAGLEALVRWNNPELGDVPPARFIPVAEESGLIVELGGWIFDRACAEVRAWLDSAVVFGSLSVNISPAQFQQPDFVDGIAQCLADHGVAGEYFVIEITENVLMLDPERASEILHQLRDLGMRIAVDDFGTGYSSMAYLRQFPVQCIKLDQAFVSTIPGNHIDSTIIGSVIDLAGALGLSLIAEGVETERQRDALVEWGCVSGQGFLYSRPCARSAITDRLLAQGRSDAPVIPPAADGGRQ